MEQEHLKRKKRVLSKKSTVEQGNLTPKMSISIKNDGQRTAKVLSKPSKMPAEESKKVSLENQLEVGNSIQNVNINLLGIVPSDTEGSKPKR